MCIKILKLGDSQNIVPLIAQFRVELNSLKGIKSANDIESAEKEFEDYINSGYPLFAYIQDGEFLGYLVCRVEKPTVWVESLYVCPDFRMKGITTKLFKTAEQLAESYGEPTMYFYVHPNNNAMLSFLSKHNYDVLNLIEIRKKYPTEEIHQKIMVGERKLNY